MERPAVTQALLVPLDGSPLADHAIPFADAIAAPDARIVLFRVLVQENRAEELLDRLGSREEVAQASERAARESLETSAGLLHRRGGVELAITSGAPADTILAAVEAQGVGGVVIASHGRGAVGRWLFGSVADRIARACPVPVVIVRPEDPDGAPAPVTLRRVLVPLDGSDLAMQALPVATRLARCHGWPVHLLTAIDLATMVPVAAPGPAMPISGDLYERVFDVVRAGAQQALTDATNRLSAEGVTASSEIRIGAPYAAITDVIAEGDLVVLCSHGRTGVRRWLLGSVAEQLVRFAPAPVMLVPVAGRQEVAHATFYE